MAKPAVVNSGSQTQEKLIELITPLVAPMGYEIVFLEVQTHRQKILRIFIDRLNSDSGKRIGIEDCTVVSRALDEPLEQLPEIEEIFHGAYELEVSSPGIDRPLRQRKDYERFSGKEVRVHVYRPLTAEELGNGTYQSRNPKQKNFLGTLRGLKDDKVLLAIPGKQEVTVTIPLPLISKANLEPKFDEFKAEERE